MLREACTSTPIDATVSLMKSEQLFVFVFVEDTIEIVKVFEIHDSCKLYLTFGNTKNRVQFVNSTNTHS